MVFQRFTIAILLYFYLPMLMGQGIQGIVQTKSGIPVSFASVYFPEIAKGTTANLEGYYQLQIPKGKYEVIVQYLGYQSYKDTVTILSDWITMNVTLEVQHYNLSEVIITASGEDPANFVMRKAIGMSQYYKNQIGEYQAKVYLKGTGVPIKIPKLFRKQLKEDGIEEGKYYVTETISDILFQIGQPLQTKVSASRSAGFGDDATPMQFVTISLYDDINGIISPLSRDAFAVYKFKLEGTFVVDGHSIFKIRVLPKRKGQDLYRGTIHIREGSWSLYMVDLSVEQKLFNATIKQVYQTVAPYVWMPVSHDFNVNLDFMGGKARFTYLVTVSDYKIVLNPIVDHQFYFKLFDKDSFETFNEEIISQGESKAAFEVVQQHEKIIELTAKDELSNKEMRKLNRLIGETNSIKQKSVPLEIKSRETQIADSAKLMDRAYWDRQRPVPLTDEERLSFNEVDATKDSSSIDAGQKKIFNSILWGVQRKQIHDSLSLSYPGLLGLQSFGFNTVDGFSYKQTLTLKKQLPSHGFWKTDLDLGYAFSRRQLFGKAGFNWLYDPIKRSSITVLIGSESQDYNHDRGMLPLLNAVTSLFFRQNFLKLHQNDYAEVGFQTDITNGLVFEFKLGYNHFSNLNNNSSFSIFNPFKTEYTENIPPAFKSRPELFANHRSLEYSAQLSWTPRYFYRIKNGKKQMAYSKYPTFSVLWKQSIDGVLRADTDFSQIEFRVRQNILSRLYGNFTYEFSAGSFPWMKKIYFQNYYHLQTQPLLIAESPGYNSFLGLSYYDRSLAGNYFTGFIHLEHSRIAIKRIPFLANSLLRESLSLKVHAGDGFHPYYEINYGVHQIFLLMNVNVFAGFEKGSLKTSGIRIGIPIRGGTIAL